MCSQIFRPILTLFVWRRLGFLSSTRILRHQQVRSSDVSKATTTTLVDMTTLTLSKLCFLSNSEAMQLPEENDEDMRLPGFKLGQDLITYAKQLRKVVYSETEHQHVTVVLGNPSCDLDSFICSFVLSYFYNGRSVASKSHKSPIYVPVLNLPYIEGKDLWRQRPEFAVALRGALDGLTPQSTPWSPDSEEYKKKFRQRDEALLEQLITIHELSNGRGVLKSLHTAFQPSSGKHEDNTDTPKSHKQELILVDHNAPAIETIRDGDIKQRFQVIGVVDHHVEENYVPKDATPRIVKLGIGSCMSLVVDHLRSMQIWTAQKEHQKLEGYAQISRLALTPVLIDTWNLEAPGDRVSALDREAADFLDAQTGSDFNRNDLFEQVQTAKSEALNLLEMQEIFAHDYKSYTERTEDYPDPLNIGIASVVKDMEWLVKHAGGHDAFVNEMLKYATNPEKPLTLFSLLTRKDDRKEVAVFGLSPIAAKAIRAFQEKAHDELKLEAWDEDSELQDILDSALGQDRGGGWAIWWMGDISRSRKQVAPLLRTALQERMKED